MSTLSPSTEKESLGAALRAGFGRILAKLMGDRQGAAAMPVLSGPARGLWFREEALPAVGGRGLNRTMQTLAKICKEGWTVWDCAGESGYSTILFSRFVGADGLVVSFEPERNRFLSTFDNATLNGCHNIMFLFSELGVVAPKTFGPPVRARKIGLDEVYQDEEIPIPQLIALNLETSAEAILSSGKRLLTEKRPILVIHRYSDESLKTLRDFSTRNRYKLFSLDTNAELTDSERPSGSLLLFPE